MSIEHLKKGGHRVEVVSSFQIGGHRVQASSKKGGLSRGSSCVVDMGVPPGLHWMA